MLLIFPPKSIKQRLDSFKLDDYADMRQKREKILEWQNAIKNGNVKQSKEESLQSDFLNHFFGDVLGYIYSRGADEYNLEKEEKAITDSTKADGALGYFSLGSHDTRAVIELKDASTDLDNPQNRKNDKRSPVEQAFSYASKSGGKCKWVIVSNFIEIRLYHSSDQSKYEVFNIPDLLKLDELKRFLFLLHKDRLICRTGESEIEKLFAQRLAHEKSTEDRFYKEFKKIRWELFQHLQNHNPNFEEQILFEKAQKLLDRFIFVFFCEDLSPPLLPSDTTRKILDAYRNRGFDPSDDILWRHSKGLFQFINNGEPRADINKFNGGLFAQDEVLDNLVIKDEFLQHVIKIGEDYDFDADLNVNVLGHIFEQSISDIEEIKAQIAGEVYEKKKGKRKKDGVFYTPAYITKYIVEQTVGKWLEDRKQELGFYELPELDYTLLDPNSPLKELAKAQKAQLTKAINKHLEFWLAYKQKLSSIKILDPACGSGAFLNQAFDYLHHEHRIVDDAIADLRSGQRDVIENINKLILQNNLFGVDLNEESVEITKLSLWLKTANKSNELTSLDGNIKCGNSLIDDPAFAGKKAFNWQKEFKDIEEIPKVCVDSNILFDYFREELGGGRAFKLIQLAEAERINLKISTRVRFETNKGKSHKLNEELAFVESLSSLPCIARYDVSSWDSGDVYASEEDIKLWQKIKNIIFSGLDLLTPPQDENDKQREKRIGRIIDCDHLLTASGIAQVKKVDYFVTNNTQDFINNGKREKLQKLLNIEIVTLDEFLDRQTDKIFGFDVVIGNPPYVRQELLSPFKPYFEKNYACYHGVCDLYVYFIEKGQKLLKENGYYGVIIANKWMRANYGNALRDFLKEKVQLREIIDFGDLPVFEDATTYPCILVYSQNQPLDKFKASSLKELEPMRLIDTIEENKIEIEQSKLDSKGWNLGNSSEKALLEKISSKGVPLGEYVEDQVYRGVLTGFNEAFVIDEATRKKLIAEDPKSEEIIKPFLAGREVKRYSIDWQGDYLIFAKRGIDIEKYPAIKKYLEKFRERLEPRPKDFQGADWKGRKPGSYKWYELQDAIDYYQEFEKPKIVYPELGIQPSFSIDRGCFYGNKTTFIIPQAENYLLCLLNSKVTHFYIDKVSSVMRGGYYMFSSIYVETIPIPKILLPEQEPFILKADLMLDKNKELQTTKQKFSKLIQSEFKIQKFSQKLEKWNELEWIDFEKELQKVKVKSTLAQKKEWMEFFETEKKAANEIQAVIDKTDKEIDQMVYELYGLTDEEIAIVEG